MYLMCRLCFADQGTLELIFEIEKTLLTTINDILFEIKDIDGWPAGICEDCKCKLTMTKNFIRVCKNTQKTLLEQLGGGESSQESQEDNTFDDSSTDYHLQLTSDDETSKIVINTDSEVLDQIQIDTSDNESLLEELVPVKKKKEKLITSEQSTIKIDNSIKPITPSKKPVGRPSKKARNSEPDSKDKENDSLKKKFKCKICEKTFDFKAGLGNHMRSHSGKSSSAVTPRKKTTSKWCENSESDDSSADEKPLECDKCDRTFANRANLGKHMVSHFISKSTEKPFKCNECDRRFSFKGGLGCHMRSHSKKTLENSPESNWTRNSVTEMNFDTSAIVSSEERSPEPKKRKKIKQTVFECLKCDKVLGSQQSLVLHQVIHLAVRPFKCELCEGTFNYKCNLITHCKNVHSGNTSK